MTILHRGEDMSHGKVGVRPIIFLTTVLARELIAETTVSGGMATTISRSAVAGRRHRIERLS